MIFNETIGGQGGSGSVGVVELPIQTEVVPNYEFVQPVLTSNGTIGGDSFAVLASSEYNSDSPAWRAFDNDQTTLWHSNSGMPQWIEFYNPVAIAVSKLSFFNRSTSYRYQPKSWEILYSDDGIDWNVATTGLNPEERLGIYIDCDIPVPHNAKYWRFVINSTYNNPSYANIDEILLETYPTNKIYVLDNYLSSSASECISGQTVGYKNNIYVVEDYQNEQHIKISSLGTLPVGTDKTVLKSTTFAYLDSNKTNIVNSKDGLSVTVEEAIDESGLALTTIGSPTLSGTIASGFSGSDYYSFKKIMKPGSSSWEFRTKITTPSSISYSEICDTITDQRGFRFRLDSGKFNLLVSNGSSWIDTSHYAGSHSVQTDTTYYIKCGYSSLDTKYYLDYSTNGTDWTRDIQYTNSSVYGAGGLPQLIGKGSTSYSICSMDLSETYITIGGVVFERAWVTTTPGSVTTKQGHTYVDETYGYAELDSDLTKNASQLVVHSEDFQLTEFTNFTEVGSPTISNKVASGFTSSNHITTKESFNPNTNPWEIVIKFKLDSFPADFNRTIFSKPTSSWYGLRLEINPSGKLHYLISSTIDNVLLESSGSNTISLDTWTYAKMKWTGTLYEMSISTDGSTWISDYSASSSTNMYVSSSTTYLGHNPLIQSLGYNSFFSVGSIDLTECYIKINNDIWWMPYTSYKIGYLELIKPTSSTTTTILTSMQNPTAVYAGSVCTPTSLNKKIFLDETLIKIRGSEDI